MEIDEAIFLGIQNEEQHKYESDDPAGTTHSFGKIVFQSCLKLSIDKYTRFLGYAS